jgi:NAD(P)-dependent dehydrogenase (short-subunit alcohol dehydrogenase family)
VSTRQVALVTGAGIGIGQGIALELGQRGIAVAVHYAQSEAGAREVVDEIQGLGGEAFAIAADLREVTESRRVVGETVRRFGGLDILVNNAGVTVEQEISTMDESTYNDLFALNVRSYYFCAQEAVSAMEQRGGGSIINISSVHGYAGLPLHSAYAATKGAIVAFTRALAIELAPKRIRVNAVGPGIVEVPRYFDDPTYTTERGGSWVPWGRVGRPADVAQAVGFLVSPDADFITGQILYVDGGTTARMALWQDRAAGASDQR